MLLTNKILYLIFPGPVVFLCGSNTGITSSIYILTLYEIKCMRVNQLLDIPKESKGKNLI